MADKALLEELIPIARAAGAAILDVYASQFTVRSKADESPVTEADERAEAIILEALSRLTPSIPIVSEEAAAQGRVPSVGEAFWLVDPLDGTREFVSRNGEFTVNIALVEGRAPALGIVLAPAVGCLYAGAPGEGAFLEDAAGRRPIQCARASGDGLVVVCSRSHGDADDLKRFMAGRNVASFIGVGSSLKFCLVARGDADLYPRLGPTMEWDTAAGHAILLAAGGWMRDLAGAEFVYGKQGFANPAFVAGSGEWQEARKP